MRGVRGSQIFPEHFICPHPPPPQRGRAVLVWLLVGRVLLPTQNLLAVHAFLMYFEMHCGCKAAGWKYKQ